MKFLTVSVALCCLAAHAAARDETFQAVLNFVDGEKLTMNFGPEYKSYYQKSNSDVKVATIDLVPNRENFQNCAFLSTQSAKLILERPDNAPPRFRVEPPTKVQAIDCTKDCVDTGKRCFNPATDSSFKCCEGYCSSSGICKK